MKSQQGEFFKTTIGVRQRCLLSPIICSTCSTLFNLFVKTIVQETVHNTNHKSISIGGRPVCSILFADDIDLMGGSSGKLQDLTNRLVDRVTAYGMEVSTEKSKIVS